MIPNYQYAKQRAKEVFDKYGTNDPLEIIKRQPCVLVMSFADMANAIGATRELLVTICGEDNNDAVTTVQTCSKGNTRYLITYNQQLPDYRIRTALARELGHIALEQAGIERKLTPYSCRHTTATVLGIHANVAPQTLQRVMRWKSTKMMDRYVTPSDQDARKAVNKI